MSNKTSQQNLIIGIIIGAIVGVLIMLFGLEVLPGGYTYVVTIMTVTFFVIASVFYLIVQNREHIFQALFGEVEDLDSFRSDAQNLTSDIAKAVSDKLTEELPKEYQDRSRQVAPRLANFLIWGRIRRWWLNWLVAILVAIGGLTTTILLVNQNELLEVQNKKITVQTQLMESERRSSLVFLMSNVLDKVDDEIGEQSWKKDSIERLKVRIDSIPNNLKYDLSDVLISRIVALSRALQPYRRLQGNTLESKLVSPERGQLFIALMKNKLNSSTRTTIVSDGDFSNAIIGNITLRMIDLRKANLSGADLREANLSDADFRSANLSRTNLYKTNLSDAKLNLAELFMADLREASLNGANLTGAHLRRADLRGANLFGANLRAADLSRARFSAKDLSNVNLEGAKVHSADWIQELDGSDEFGLERITDKYYVDDKPHENENGDTYYIIREK